MKKDHRRGISRGRGACIALAALVAAAAAHLAAPPRARAVGETATQLTSLLADLRPDSERYVGRIRRVPRLHHPATHYMALVRPGGSDPFRPADAPRPGPDRKNDILFYPDTFGIERSEAWRLLLLDHEYLHAKHLSGGHSAPLVRFGRMEADRHFLEAAAWGHNLAEARMGTYGDLTPREWSEVRANFTRHLDALRKFVEGRQPAAWDYYARFFPEP